MHKHKNLVSNITLYWLNSTYKNQDFPSIHTKLLLVCLKKLHGQSFWELRFNYICIQRQEKGTCDASLLNTEVNKDLLFSISVMAEREACGLNYFTNQVHQHKTGNTLFLRTWSLIQLSRMRDANHGLHTSRKGNVSATSIYPCTNTSTW